MKHRLCIGLFGLLSVPWAHAAPLATYRVNAAGQQGSYTVTGTVEALRQGTLGAQVSGRVLEVLARSGESVRAGQALIRIEAEEAQQAATAGTAAARGADARFATAKADFERAQKLQAQGYLSLAALQRSDAAMRSAEAEALAMGATASAARTRAAWRTVTAPYDGIVTDVLVAAGDLATPGRPLIAMYAPGALRVVAQVPESIAGRLQLPKPAFLISDDPDAPLQAVSSWSVVSAVDPATHSVEVRAELPAKARLQPGQFARVQLPLAGSATELRVPARAVLTRSEVTAVYVVDANGSARLRQVRLGPVVGDEVTVLSGLKSGERIALDPVMAGRN